MKPKQQINRAMEPMKIMTKTLYDIKKNDKSNKDLHTIRIQRKDKRVQKSWQDTRKTGK